MSDRILLRGGRVFTQRQCKNADVLIGGGVVQAIAPRLEGPADQVIDLEGLVLAPGFVDVHVHLRQPGFSKKETVASGTRAAAAGGFTTVCAMPNLSPVPDSISHLQAQLDIIAQDALIEVLPYAAISIEEKGQQLSDIEGLAPRCAGFSDDGKGVQSAAMMAEAMARIAAAGSRISAHCEDEALLLPGGCVHDGEAAQRFGVVGISSQSEYAQFARDIDLVRKTRVPYHLCHISTRESVALLRQAKAEGLPITGECTPHQLLLSERDITADDGRFKMNPPLRTEADRLALIEGLLDGTIDCIATDHAPHTAAEKAQGLAGSAFGVVGLETAFAAAYTTLVLPGLCPLSLLLEKLSAAPAALLGREADIREGMAANLVALDTETAWTVDPDAFITLGRSTPFAGRTLTGRVMHTWFHGTPVYRRETAQ